MPSAGDRPMRCAVAPRGWHQTRRGRLPRRPPVLFDDDPLTIVVLGACKALDELEPTRLKPRRKNTAASFGGMTSVRAKGEAAATTCPR